MNEACSIIVSTLQRGKLYKWGPNHAADPIVMRLQSTPAEPGPGPGPQPSASARVTEQLEVVLIQRKDNSTLPSFGLTWSSDVIDF